MVVCGSEPYVADCNNKLGGREHEALLNFYQEVRTLIESSFVLPRSSA